MSPIEKKALLYAIRLGDPGALSHLQKVPFLEGLFLLIFNCQIFLSPSILLLLLWVRQTSAGCFAQFISVVPRSWIHNREWHRHAKNSWHHHWAIPMLFRWSLILCETFFAQFDLSSTSIFNWFIHACMLPYSFWMSSFFRDVVIIEFLLGIITWLQSYSGGTLILQYKLIWWSSIWCGKCRYSHFVKW